MSLLQVNTAFNINLQFETSQFHYRLFAWLIDLVILILFLRIMFYLLNYSFDISNASQYGLTEIFVFIPFLLYHLLCELFIHGQSIGKLILGIKVVSLTGRSASASQSLLRWLMRFLDFGILWGFVFLVSGQFVLGTILVLGCITSFILFVSTKYNQRIGDLLAETTVVRKKLPYKLSDTIFQDLDTKGYRVFFPAVMRLSDKDINIIDNVVKNHQKASIEGYVQTVAFKIKSVLKIETDMPDEIFLETLLRDYNYLSRK